MFNPVDLWGLMMWLLLAAFMFNGGEPLIDTRPKPMTELQYQLMYKEISNNNHQTTANTIENWKPRSK